MLRPEHAGKLTAEAWTAYTARFMLLLGRIEDPDEDCSMGLGCGHHP
jgi:hypothetical protein